MAERLKPPVEDLRFWVGPDIVTTEERTIDAYDYDFVPVLITPASIPPLMGKHPEYLKNFFPSGRSRLAQAGVEPYEVITQQIAKALVASNSQDILGTVRNSFIAQVLMINNAARPVRIEKNSGVFRLFNRWGRPYATGQEVVSLIESGRVKIKGTYDKEWRYAYGGTGESLWEQWSR